MHGRESRSTHASVLTVSDGVCYGTGVCWCGTCVSLLCWDAGCGRQQAVLLDEGHLQGLRGAGARTVRSTMSSRSSRRVSTTVATCTLQHTAAHQRAHLDNTLPLCSLALQVNIKAGGVKVKHRAAWLTHEPAKGRRQQACRCCRQHCQ